jgi:hypothetical protein
VARLVLIWGSQHSEPDHHGLDGWGAVSCGAAQAASLVLRSNVETRWRVTPKCSAICSIVRPSS